MEAQRTSLAVALEPTRCDGAVLDRYLTRTGEGGLQVRYDGIAIRVPLCADAPRAAGGEAQLEHRPVQAGGAVCPVAFAGPR